MSKPQIKILEYGGTQTYTTLWDDGSLWDSGVNWDTYTVTGMGSVPQMNIKVESPIMQIIVNKPQIKING